MLPLNIRKATTEDAGELLAIYRPIVEETAISFELEPPSVDAFAARIKRTSRTHVWLVGESDSRLLGYAYATPHRSRGAYQYSVETSAYVHADFNKQGIGSRLYEQLFEEMCAFEFYNAFAAVTLPNAASEALHFKLGFRQVGTLPAVGFKFGKWHDVSWWHRRINPGSPGSND